MSALQLGSAIAAQEQPGIGFNVASCSRKSREGTAANFCACCAWKSMPSGAHPESKLAIKMVRELQLSYLLLLPSPRKKG